MSKKKDFRDVLPVFCACGAAWFGQSALENPIIKIHRLRGANGVCRLVSHAEYLSLFGRRCHCEACKLQRSKKRKPITLMRAAAPDLLAALKAASDELVLHKDSPLRLQIDAAINKAEGR